MPTLAELTGVKLVNADIDGRSLVGVIRSAEASSPHEVLHWQVDEGPNAQWAVRAGPWKLIGNVRDTSERSRGFTLSAADAKWFLSNLAEDVSERHNYASEHGDVVRRLQTLHAQWLKQCGR
jgi:arylsulfatase A-like enzyme